MASDISLKNYSYTSPVGYEGAPAGTTVNFDLRGTLEGFINADSTTLPFGRVVVNKSGGQGLPTATNQTVAGVSIALAHYAADTQFRGNAGTPPDYPLTLAKNAILYLLPETNITKGASIFYRCINKATVGTNEALGRIRADADNLAVSNVALTSNVATITTAAAHGFAVGQVVTIAGLTTTALNGTYTVASVPTATTFTFAKTNSNISSAADSGTIARAAEISGFKLMTDAVAGELVRVEIDL